MSSQDVCHGNKPLTISTGTKGSYFFHLIGDKGARQPPDPDMAWLANCDDRAKRGETRGIKKKRQPFFLVEVILCGCWAIAEEKVMKRRGSVRGHPADSAALIKSGWCLCVGPTYWHITEEDMHRLQHTHTLTSSLPVFFLFVLFST